MFDKILNTGLLYGRSRRQSLRKVNFLGQLKKDVPINISIFSSFQIVCLCLERAIDTVREKMGELVHSIAELLVELHSKIQRSCVLDTAVMVTIIL